MRKQQNIYERLAGDLELYQANTVERLAKDLMGGKQPPWSVRLSGQQKRDYFMSLPDDRKLTLVQQMDEGEREELRKLLDQGGGIDAGTL